MELTLTTGILIAAVSFAAEYVDSSLGMGYGTTLTPVLLLMGFAPLEVVPALLVSQLLAGLLSGFVHHSMGNVNLKPLTLSPSVVWRNVRRFGVRESFRRGLPRGLQVALVITVASVVGTVAAVLLAVNLPEKVLRLYVAALVLAIGIVILVTIKLHLAFSWKRIVGLGMLAAFTKASAAGATGRWSPGARCSPACRCARLSASLRWPRPSPAWWASWPTPSNPRRCGAWPPTWQPGPCCRCP